MAVHYHGKTAAGIAASIEAAVRDADLAPGEALPPVRRLAADLGVSPATVASAYRELRQRAVIETAGRAGTRVRARPAVAPPASRQAYRLDVPRGARDLSHGGPDPRLLPPLREALARLAKRSVWRMGHGYEAAGPVRELVTLARERFDADGVPGGEITVTSGALDGIERTLAAHLAPGDRVAVEDPGWANLLDLLAALRLQPVPVPVDREGPTVDGMRDAVSAGARAAVITSRAQNPTGAAVTADRAADLRQVLARRPELLIIEDDHSAELSEQPLVTLAGATDAWAFIRSASKPYGSDLRLAVLAADPATLARVAGRQRLGAGWVSTVLQRLVVELWRDRHTQALIAEARTVYRQRRDGLRLALAERGVTAYGRSGINLWVPVADETAVLTRLRDAGWVAAPGAMFRLRSAPGVRLTVSQLGLGDIGPLAEAVATACAGRPIAFGA